MMPELKVLLAIGFFAGILPNYSPQSELLLRVFSSIIGTVSAGVVWIFIKPYAQSLHKKFLKRKRKK